MSSFRFKILLSLIFAYFVSWYLSSHVFLAGTPVVRPDALHNVLQLPIIAKEAAVKTLAHFSPIKTPPPSLPNSNNPSPSNNNSWIPNNSPVPPPPTTQPGSRNPPTATPTQGYVFISPTPTLTPVPGVPTVPPQPTSTPAPITKAEFAQCITSKGMKFYVNAACPYCKQTKQEFGTAYQYLTEVNCDQQRQLCRSKPGVGIGPAWEKANGEIIPGAMDFQSLSYVASCQKPNIN